MSSLVYGVCSGALIANLLHDQCENGQLHEGFLFGQIHSRINEQISDSQICHEKSETVISISSYMPCTSFSCFYSGSGRVNRKNIEALLGNRFENVVGWYRCRDGVFDDFYLKETLVHKQLTEIFNHASEHFLMGLMTCNYDGTSGTVSSKYKFSVMKNGEFESIFLEISNMGDTSTAGYIQHQPLIDFSPKSIFKKIKNIEPGVKEVEAMHHGLIENLSMLLPRYSECQENYHKLLQEVRRLRALCYANNIAPDFTPCGCRQLPSDFSLDICEENKSSPVLKRGPKGSPVKKAQATTPKKDKAKEDHFDFISKEMEKCKSSNKDHQRSKSQNYRDRSATPPGKGGRDSGISPRRNSGASAKNEDSPSVVTRRRSAASQNDNPKDSTSSPVSPLLNKRNRTARRITSRSSSQCSQSTSPAETKSKVRELRSQNSLSESHSF